MAELPLQWADKSWAAFPMPLLSLPQVCSPTCWDSRVKRNETTGKPAVK